MGKRKERRIAAMSAAGRRVKLDLFAEPSGDLGGSSAPHEAVEDDDSNNGAGLPNSPSSSGPPPENPLMLLEQYSDDDELDEESKKGIDEDSKENASPDLDDQVNVASGKEYEGETNGDPQSIEQFEKNEISASLDEPLKVEENGVGEYHNTESSDLLMGVELTEERSAPATSDVPVVGDVILGWKMVLHNDSNQYYYWNTLTGETSWEVPEEIAKAPELSREQKVFSDAEEKAETALCENEEIFDQTDKTEVFNDAAKDACVDDKERIQDITTSSLDDALLTIGDARNGEDNSNPLRLVKFGEDLLERLNSLKGSEGHQQGNDWISKYISEVEIRLSDYKSLSSHGVSLLPFWVHSESKLKQLEADIGNELEVQKTHSNCGDGIKKADSTENKAVCSTSEDCVSTEMEAQKDSHNEAYNDVNSENISSSGEGGHVEVTPEILPQPSEDVDMDIDMEVEDAIPMPPNSVVEQEVNCVQPPPPPPDDEPFPPPPPPDDEPFPPPPPDEPPESSYPLPPPQTDSNTVQPFSYTEQYISYPNSDFFYYPQTQTDVAGSNFYTNSQPPTYYEAVPAYFDHQDGTLPAVSVVGGVDSYSFNGKIGHESLGNTQTDVSSVSLEKEHASTSGIYSAPAFIQAPTTISVTNFVSLPSTTAATATTSVASTATSVAATATTTVSKPEAKVSRKKRAVAVGSTLRSNKKVSGLVDKWKAAKEELHEDDEEDEPENAYEALEKKRQREIEEWRAQQIASGEAKENANFQPLGGDWRERVKRRRAQLQNGTASKKRSPSVEDGDQQPDLNKLSKDLPSGWQAYWDESSKQVYYGNAVTSETTWIKPTN